MKCLTALLPLAAAFCVFPASAQERPDSINLYAIMEQVADDIDREIVVDPGIATMRVSLGQGEIRVTERPTGYSTEDDIDYESFLAILRATGLIAVETGDQILIVPEDNARAVPSRLLQEDDARVSDHEIVTRVIRLPDLPEAATPPSNNIAAQLVPVLRPMLPQTAQFGAITNTNMLVVVDRYDNVRRITAVIEEIIEGLED